jgi:hypothetical protein
MLYDAFICHASEDKNEFVRPLAELLQRSRVEVWYDEFSLKIGDSLRRSIDIGLAKSRYGIVVLSPNFFNKSWPQWELDGLVQRQNDVLGNVILPIWHNVTKRDVIAFSPPLADKYAIPSTLGLDKVVSKLLGTIRPEGSTLLIARDRLLDFCFEPPVVTDDWWLEVIEQSASNPVEGTFQSSMGWGRWGFPLPPKGDKPVERGERLAWAAMQMKWQERADTLCISQITHPDQVFEFIRSQPGLRETCHDYLPYLISYAPQLTIKGFGGEFEDKIDYLYTKSVKEHEKRRKAKDTSGTALTINGLHPTCDEALALRHPTFGDYDAALIACCFVQGDIMGPRVKFYDCIDYIAWLLSDQSKWMPEHTRGFLLEGMKDWAAWDWHKHIRRSESGFKPNSYTGSLADLLWGIRDNKKPIRSYKLTDSCLRDIQTRLSFSAKLLLLNETGEELTQRFLDEQFIQRWIKDRRNRTERTET